MDPPPTTAALSREKKVRTRPSAWPEATGLPPAIPHFRFCRRPLKRKSQEDKQPAMSTRSAASSSSRDRDRSPLLQQYGSEDAGLLPTMARSTPLRPQQQGLLKKSSVFYALNGVALLALLSVCVSMHSTITRLESQVATQTTSNHAASVPPEAATMRASRRHRPAHKHDEDDDEELVVERLPMVFLPSKFAVDYVTPRQNQAHRGTCWDFATVGFLEQSYRQNGVQNGWLAEDEYVAFSEQAYGVEILNLCTGPADSPQQKACRVAGDAVWENSTEGGEVPVLYYLREGLQESIFPQSVCKYYENGGNDTLCPGMEAARELNPLKFSVKSMDTKYEDMSVREHLFRKKQAMPLSTPVAMVTHYYPCIGSFASDPHCQPDHCTLCPPELAMTTCCVPMKGGSNRNMEGEFFSHHGMSIEGGHAMLLVGYNDAFLTREGFTGGLIVKNSWSDGPTQGSHSLAYWMQEVSDWEERTVCPNSWNPFNWYQCGNEGVNARKGSVGDANSTETFNERVQECLSEETQIFAETNVQPLHLKCKDATQCKTDGDFVYFVRNTTDWGDRMTVMCLWEYSVEQHIAREVCLKPMLELQIARTLAPVAAETKENDTDRCGFYFIPYEALRKWIMQFQGFFVNSFELEWDPRSYVANKENYEEFDYSLLEASTKKQNTSHFLGPFPYAQVVESFRKN